jgi:hypothetical protein
MSALTADLGIGSDNRGAKLALDVGHVRGRRMPLEQEPEDGSSQHCRRDGLAHVTDRLVTASRAAVRGDELRL